MATLAVSLVAQAGGLVQGLLAAHRVRLKDATDENHAASLAIPAFDSSIVGIADAFDNGQISASDALQALQGIDQQTMGYLQQQVGKPGTAWSTSSSGVCDKTCTVGCCVYNTFLHPVTVRMAQLLQSGSGTLHVPSIPTNKYGFPARPGYDVPISKPAQLAGGGVPSFITGLVNSVTGQTSPVQRYDSAGALQTPASAPGRSPLVLILIALAGVLVLIRLFR